MNKVLIISLNLALLFANSNFAYSAEKPVGDSVEKLKSYLLSSDQNEAIKAANALGSMQTEEALDALIGTLQLGPHPAVMLSIIEGIGRHKKPRTLGLLGFYAKHRRVDIRVASLEAALNIDSPTVDKMLLEALGDSSTSVRALAAREVGDRGLKQAERPLFLLFKRGDKSAASPLGKVAGPETAKQLGELIGVVASSSLASAMGTMLMRKDFGPDPLRNEIVKTLGKLEGAEVPAILKEYIASVPEKDTRQSKITAKKIIDTRKN